MRKNFRPVGAVLAAVLSTALIAGCTISSEDDGGGEVSAGSALGMTSGIDADSSEAADSSGAAGSADSSGAGSESAGTAGAESAGSAGSSESAAGSSLEGAKIRVGSKEFDEQLLLGQVAVLVLKAVGADPVDETNITGTDNVRKALTSNEIDLYWEYTGTGWVNILGESEQIPDPADLFDAVKAADAENGVAWWARSPANNTYALAANQSVVDEYDIKTLSDYAALVKEDPAAAATCMGPEFKSRDDGFAGLSKAYDFTMPDSAVHQVNDAVVYTTVGKGSDCVFGSVAATDGRIAAQKLVVLEDDKDFFPVYNPAITIRSEVAEQYPQLEQVFAPVAEKLDSDVLTELNKKVSVDGEAPAKVAKDWLTEEGFIS